MGRLQWGDYNEGLRLWDSASFKPPPNRIRQNMLWLEVFLLAVIQGVTEFLPISSSGHTVVGEAIFAQFGHSLPEKLTLHVVLHLGTLAAILVFYWRRIWQILRADRRVILLLLVGSIPAGIIGVSIKKLMCEEVLGDPVVTGFMFLVTGGLLLWSAKHESGEMTCRELSYGQAFSIGVFQAFAILPGVSRSGATIVAGLGHGLRRDEAATFSFLLAIPAIGGAGLLEAIDLLSNGGSETPLAALLLGCLVSFLVGLAALAWLIRWLQQGRLHLFAWWVFPLGIAVLAWQLLA
jgi:undecaprenyl-diphosphatase